MARNLNTIVSLYPNVVLGGSCLRGDMTFISDHFLEMRSFPPSEYPSRTMIMWLVSIGAAVPLLWLLFHEFGAGIAFVIVPVVAIAIAAYGLHLKRLAQKTSQISEASRVHLATVEALAT